MSETTTQRTARLLSMSNAALIMHAQDLTLERDTLQEALSATVEQRDELLAELEFQRDRNYNPFEPDNQCNNYKRLCAAIARMKGGAA